METTGDLVKLQLLNHHREATLAIGRIRALLKEEMESRKLCPASFGVPIHGWEHTSASQLLKIVETLLKLWTKEGE